MGANPRDTLDLLDDEGHLHALAPEWESLWRATPGASPFQSPHWLLPWWRQFGTGQPHVATLRTHGRLAGVLALYVYEARLLPIGAGLSDALDVLAPDDRSAAALLGFALDAAERRGITACDLIELPPDSRLLAAACPWHSQVQPSTPCPVLPLSPGLATSVPARQLRKLRMSRHRADRIGGHRITLADAASLPSYQARLFALHQARWTAQGEPGVFADPRVAAFHRDAGPRLLQAGLLRLAALHLRGTPAAVIAALLSPGAIHFYLSGFDEAFAFESPGTLLLGAMLETAATEGRTEANFLRGQEAYKYAWGAADRPNVMRLLRRTTADAGS